MTKLNPQQERMLLEIAAAQAAYKRVKITARAEVERRVRENIARLAEERDAAIHHAIEIGIPKSQVAMNIGLSSTKAVTEAYDRHQERIDNGQV